MKTIVFQGDSITACGRLKYDVNVMGEGYARFVRASLGFDHPGEYECHNRGISGHRIVDTYARIKADIINLKPDYLSILIGVNDVWHEFEHGNGVEDAKFERFYCMLIEEIKEALPDIKIMLLEPFCMKGEVTEKWWEPFSSEVRSKAEITKRVAKKYQLSFVPLQEKMNELAKKTGPQYWSVDGVHPTIEGHELIKREWLKTFYSWE